VYVFATLHGVTPWGRALFNSVTEYATNTVTATLYTVHAHDNTMMMMMMIIIIIIIE
jgi:hypothetical protein